MSVRVVYSDLDGTMVGPGGCFFRAEDRTVTLEPARVLARLLDAGVTLVLVSGRTHAQLLDACRVFGADGFVAEMGAVLGWDAGRSSRTLRGALPEQYDDPPGVVVESTGLVQRLFARYAGRLEYHSPWHAGHQADVMLRGRVDPAEVEAWLAAEGFGWLRLHDNGVLPHRPSQTLDPQALPAHVYHLMPDGITKGAGVAADLQRRGLGPADAVALGDSASDLSMAPHVGRMFLTANALRHPHMQELAGRLPNVSVTSGQVGLGWAEALDGVLAASG